MVSTADFWSAGPRFESRPRQNLLRSKPDRTARVELELLHFSIHYLAQQIRK